MSIAKEGGTHTLYCDNCGDNCGEGTWQELVEQKKRDGWGSRKEHGEWVDYCPACWAECKGGERG